MPLLLFLVLNRVGLRINSSHQGKFMITTEIKSYFSILKGVKFSWQPHKSTKIKLRFSIGNNMHTVKLYLHHFYNITTATIYSIKTKNKLLNLSKAVALHDTNHRTQRQARKRHMISRILAHVGALGSVAAAAPGRSLEELDAILHRLAPVRVLVAVIYTTRWRRVAATWPRPWRCCSAGTAALGDGWEHDQPEDHLAESLQQRHRGRGGRPAAGSAFSWDAGGGWWLHGPPSSRPVHGKKWSGRGLGPAIYREMAVVWLAGWAWFVSLQLGLVTCKVCLLLVAHCSLFSPLRRKR